MIWQNPWAWLGLAAIAIPILIHLFGRDKAPRHSFPSLRFIEIAELPPTRRTRIHDLLLLATRVAIFAVAAAALAQPLLLFASRRTAMDSQIARAIIVDTSASMSRAVANGGSALDSARAAAKRLAADARTSVVMETNAPGVAVDGAVAWLQTQSSRRELVVVSDFQVGTLDSAGLASVPSAIGVRAIQIATSRDGPIERRNLVRESSIVAHVDVAANPTVVSWTRDTRDSVRSEPRIAIDAPDRTAADALTSAAKTLAVAAPIDTTPIVSVVFRDAADRNALMKRATRVSSAPLISLVTRLLGDSLLASTRGDWTGAALDGGAAPLGPAVMNVGGITKAVAAEDTVGGVHHLLVFSDDTVASVHSAMLVGAIRRALSTAPAIGELDPSTIPSSTISAWQRAPSATPTRETVDTENGPSDARWLWLLALALLGVESWARRQRATVVTPVDKREHERAA